MPVPIEHSKRLVPVALRRWGQYACRSLDATTGLFVLNAELPIAFDGWSKMEVDVLSADLRVAVELDGPQHPADAVAYRRDRRQDRLLQEHGYLVLRFLAEDVAKDLDGGLDALLRVVSPRRHHAWTACFRRNPWRELGKD